MVALESLGKPEASRGRNLYPDDNASRRLIAVRVSNLSYMQVFSDSSDASLPSFLDMGMTVTTSGEVIIVPTSRTDIRKRRSAIYGVLSKGVTITTESGGTAYRVEFEVEEII